MIVIQFLFSVCSLDESAQLLARPPPENFISNQMSLSASDFAVHIKVQVVICLLSVLHTKVSV